MSKAIRSMPEVVVEKHGHVPPSSDELARACMAEVIGHAHEPVLFVRVKLTVGTNPALERPSLAQANLDLNGRVVRAQAAAGDMHDALEMLKHRLIERVERMALDWSARRGRVPQDGVHEWRHGQQPSARPAYFPRPPEQREIVRRKSFTLVAETPDEAVFEMDLMDYDFQLFTDVVSGADAVVYRGGPTGYRLAFAGSVPDDIATRPAAVDMTVSSAPAPRLDTDAAVQRLDLTGWPFVFFVSATRGRGCVLYRRYDGHYGLITPAD